MRRFILAVAIVLALALGTSCRNSTGDTLEKIKSEKKIKVGYISYFDITFRDGQSGETKGFLVDVLHEALKDLGIPKENVEFVETDWSTFATGLQTGKYDLSIAGTFNTPVRAKVARFSRPIFYLGNGAVVRKEDDRFHVIEDFNREGITIAVVQGEQGYEYARKNLLKATIQSQSGGDLSLAPLQVKLGKADAALSDQYILKRYCEKNSEVKDALAQNPYDVLPVCWSVSKNASDDQLLAYINAQLDAMERSGKLREIMAKYPMIPFVNK